MTTKKEAKYYRSDKDQAVLDLSALRIIFFLLD